MNFLIRRLLLSSSFLFLFGGTLTHAQANFEWVSAYQGANDVFGQDVAVNAAGEVVSVGYFIGTADFDPGPGNFDLTSPGQQDIYVTKLDPLGNLIWAHRFGNASRNRANNVYVDDAGDIYVTGYFEGTVDFNPGPATANLTSQFVVTAFVLKLDTNGDFLWVRQFGGSNGVSEGLEVTVDSNNDVIIGGYFTNDCNFNPSGGGLVYTSTTGRDGYIVKLSSAGSFIWARHIIGDNDNRINTVAVDNNDNIFIGGFFSGALDFDQFNTGTAVETTTTGQDIFIAQYNSSGMHNWSTSLQGAGNNQVNRLSVNRNGNLFVTGQFENTLDFDPGAGAANETATALESYVLSLDNSGVFNWVQRIGGAGSDLGLGITNGPEGAVYATGYFNNTADFDGTTTMNSLGNNTIYIAKYLENGTLEWTERLGGTGNDFGFNIYVDDNWDVLSTGYFRTSADFDPDGAGVVLAATNSDAYVHKLSQTCTAPVITGVGTLNTMLCPGLVDSTRVFVDGTLNDAVEWAWYEGSCGGTFLGTGDSLTVRPTVTTTYFVRPEGACGAPVPCQSVTVNVDNTPPVITLTTPITVDTDPGACYYRSDSLTPPTVTDVDCGVDTVYNDADVLLLIGTNTITWTAVDVNGNMSTEIQEVTVQDIELPTITAPADITVMADASCQASGVVLGTETSNDNCSVDTVFNDAPATFPLGTTIVTWTVTDASGNINTDTQEVTVEDQTNPVIVGLPADIVVSNDPGVCNAVVNWTAPTVTDNCTGATISQISGIANGGTFPLGTTTIQYEALDGAGNSVVGSFTVTVNDTENPTITAPADVPVSADNNCQATGVALGAPVTGDNCGVASVTNDAPSIFSLGTTVVTWTVTDDAGNVSTDVQNVIVTDNQNPTIIAPADITVSADASCQATIADLGTPVTSDNCSVASVVNDAPATFPLGNTTVTWTVTDGSGNVTTDAQEIIVVDDTDPVITGMPADISVNNDPGVCEAVVSWTDPTVTDNCTGATITLTSSIPNGDPFPVGVHTVEYTATDGSGNQVTGTFTVTVTDNENPTIAAPADLSVNANNFCTAFSVALGSPVTSDNCGVVTITNDGPAIYPLGSTVVTWTVTDAAGNSATATQNVTVVDNQDPTVVAPADIDLTADSNCQATVSDLGSPISSDNCNVVSVTNNAPAVFPLGVTVVTWTATDGSGNTATDTQDITVVDEIDPTIVGLPADISVSNDLGNCDAVVTWTAPTADDNCTGATIAQTAGAASGSAFPVGVSTIEYTATDGSGNQVTGSFTITVTDNENPTIVAAADTVIEANNFCVALNIVLDAPTVNDNCSVASVVNNAPVIYPLGNTIVTWTVTDAAGNTATATQNVTVVDSTAPTITAPLPVTAYVNDSCQISGVDLGTPTYFDNCAVDTVYNNAPSFYTTGNYIITWVAEDASGNVAFATQDVTVLDTILPTANLMDTTITLSPDGPITVIGSDIDLGSTDNCGVSEVVLMQEIYDCNDLGVNQIAVEVIDVHGNILNTFITVTVLESGIDLDFDMVDDACDDNVNTTVVDVPSGFTPNGDGINDLFIIPGMSGYTSIRLTIFNRYGNLVYESDQYENDWDGTSSKNGGELPDGTYFYVLELDGGERYNGYVQINRTLK